jgi:hypothetical protein
MNIDTRHARATEGVMGSIASGNWLPALPDGTLLGPIPADFHERYEQLYETFAEAWRVNDDTTLFDYAPGTSTDTFTVVGWPENTVGQEFPTCNLPDQPGVPPEPLPLDQAEAHCSDVVDEERRANCVQDVMVTGEPGFAEAYLLTEKIERNALPTIPLLVSPENNQTVAAGAIRFTWDPATDSDGDPVTYRHCVWGVDERFAFSKCTPAPGQATSHEADLEPAQDYFWKVIAEDGKGGSTESETRRVMTPDVVQPSRYLPFLAK